jgi:hypothetical protein
MFEGIIETYNWLGPSFNDVRIIKTDIPILLPMRWSTTARRAFVTSL